MNFSYVTSFYHSVCNIVKLTQDPFMFNPVIEFHLPGILRSNFLSGFTSAGYLDGHQKEPDEYLRPASWQGLTAAF